MEQFYGIRHCRTWKAKHSGLLPKPVPKVLIKEVLEIAMGATSLNTQPWNFYVVAGEVLDRIRAGNTERNLAGVPDSAIQKPWRL